MQLIYGTLNSAKLQTMRDVLAPLPIELTGLHAVDRPLPEVDESGRDPLQNAVIKATAYYKALKRPVFSCDSGLFIRELPQEQQPGVHVRNIGGKRLSDEEMIAHYAAIARQCGGKCHAVYRNAICLVYDERHIYRHTGDDISGETFLFTTVPHEKRREGFPLDSLSLDIQSGQYYYDLPEKEVTSSMDEGFLRFFRNVLKDLEPLLQKAVTGGNLQHS